MPVAETTAPIGILGGTFDPIHYGHLRLAEEALDACGLDRVVLMPAALPNLRDAPRTPAAQRLEMARLAAAGNPRLEVDGRELQRKGTSYTVDTLAELRVERGAGRSLCLILGADAFLRLPEWSRWLQLFDLAHIVVAARPGYDPQPAPGSELDDQWQRRRAPGPAALHERPAGAILPVEIPLLQISASDIRARISQAGSVLYLLPSPVLDYIAAQRLYESQ